MKIEKFIRAFIEADYITRMSDRVPDIEKFNDNLEHLLSFRHNFNNTPQIEFGAGVFMRRLRPVSHYEKMAKSLDLIPRHLYKISEYKHKEFGDIFICYLSFINHDLGIDNKSFDLAFVVAEIESDYKIISQYNFTKRDDNVKKWYNTGGKNILNFNDELMPKNIYRFLEPVNDEDGLKEYYLNR